MGDSMCVIGLVGPFASGCSTVAKKIQEFYDYEVLSLSDELRNLFKKENPNTEPNRQKLQDFGDAIRREHGADYLATLVYDKIEAGKNYVIDSIRNPEEIRFLRRKISTFFLFGVFADADLRWERAKEKYNSDRRGFDEDDKRDSSENFDYGQRVTDSFRNADIVILNNNNIVPGNKYDEELNNKIKNYIELIEEKKKFCPGTNETNMAIAYAASMRSSCLKRKVGAAIAGRDGNIFSTGYNEVPALNDTCKSLYGTCYRDSLKTDFKQGLETEFSDKQQQDSVYTMFKKRFKILDYCRALHAEENAILNVTRTGSSSELKEATLYTSTYPCNLCANKITQVGIKKVVYFEPYPMKEAKDILSDGNVKQEPFEGVTFNAYFRLMEVIY